MFVSILGSTILVGQDSTYTSGHWDEGTSSFSVIDEEGGLSSVSGSGSAALEVATDTFQVHHDFNINNPTADNIYNTFALIHSYNESDSLSDILLSQHVESDTHFRVDYLDKKVSENYMQSYVKISCESDVSVSPMDNTISGFQCDYGSGNSDGRTKTFYDVRYRRNKMRI